MASAPKIREHVVRFLGHQESLDAFEDWFARNTWDTHLDDDLEVDRLVGAIELALAEHSSKQLDDSELAKRLNTLVANQTVTIPLAVKSVEAKYATSTTASQYYRSQFAVAG
jgi:hypothetical protein